MKYVIYGSPRSGTKLLADCFKQNGYHNFGEFFDVYSSDINESEPPSAYRININSHLLRKKIRSNVGYLQDDLMKSIQLQNRYKKFEKYKDLDNTIVTVWPASLYLYPKINELLNDRFFLCTKRNRYDRLLSDLVTYYNANYNDEVKSKVFKIDLEILHMFLSSAFKTEMAQKNLISKGRGKYINFDKLITGDEDLGFNYIVTSKDQHTDNLEEYIENIVEVKEYIEAFNSYKIC